MLATFRIVGVVEWSTPKFGGPDEEWGFSGIWGSFLDPFDQDGTDFGFKPVVGLLGLRDPGVDRSDHGSSGIPGFRVH